MISAGRWSLDGQLSQRTRFWHEAAQQPFAQSRSGQRTCLLNRDRTLPPRCANRCGRRSTGRLCEARRLSFGRCLPTREIRQAHPRSRACYCLPRYPITLVRLITLRSAIFASLVRRSSWTPSAKERPLCRCLDFQTETLRFQLLRDGGIVRFSKLSRLPLLSGRATMPRLPARLDFVAAISSSANNSSAPGLDWFVP